MGVMKRISTYKQWNETFTGRRSDSEIAAMKKIHDDAWERGVLPPFDPTKDYGESEEPGYFPGFFDEN